MPHFMVDDQFHLHDKVTALVDEHGQAGLAAIGLWALAGSQSQAKLSDGAVRTGDARRVVGDPRLANKLAKLLVSAGLWETTAVGWQFHDWRTFHKLGEAVKGERERRRELRTPEITQAVKTRDGDRCRYCGRRVSWSDRKGAAGACYDHVDPGLCAGASNIVVSCRSCNSIKARRSPEQAGMRLLPPPAHKSRSDLEPDLDPTQVGSAPGGRPQGEGQGIGQGQVPGAGQGPEPGIEVGARGEVGPAGLPPPGAVPPPRQRPVPVGSGLHAGPVSPHAEDPPRCATHDRELPCTTCTAEHHREDAR